MTTIVQMSYEDLKTVVKNCLVESINEIKELPTQPEPSDRMSLEDALLFLNNNGIPITKGQLYKETHQATIPCERFGKRLVFSRKALKSWIEARLIKKMPVQEIMTNHLAQTANKK